MAKRPGKATDPTELEIMKITTGRVQLKIIGNSPLIFNRMAEKAKRDLLMGSSRKTAAERAQNLKHNPPEEYRASVYRNKGDNNPTRIAFPAPGFKGAMMTAALDIPGAFKSEVGRLVWMTGYSIDVFGTPELKMDVVRSANQNKTPDIRTRAIIREWACEIDLRFMRGKINETSIVNLVHAAGLVAGIGDFRQEKGKGSFGQFRVATGPEDDVIFDRILSQGGLKTQDEALANFVCFDDETQELIDFFVDRVKKLGRIPTGGLAPDNYDDIAWDEQAEVAEAEALVASMQNGKGKRGPRKGARA